MLYSIRRRAGRLGFPFVRTSVTYISACGYHQGTKSIKPPAEYTRDRMHEWSCSREKFCTLNPNQNAMPYGELGRSSSPKFSSYLSAVERSVSSLSYIRLVRSHSFGEIKLLKREREIACAEIAARRELLAGERASEIDQSEGRIIGQYFLASPPPPSPPASRSLPWHQSLHVLCFNAYNEHPRTYYTARILVSERQA